MLSFATYRQAFRIPWIRENRHAVRFLADFFHLLIALYRSRRRQEFRLLQELYFRMIHSFAQYGRQEAKDTVDRVLAIPFFAARRRAVYRAIAAYNGIMTELPPEGAPRLPSPPSQARLSRYTDQFFQAMKELTDFDFRDERRIRRLLADRKALERAVDHVLGAVAG